MRSQSSLILAAAALANAAVIDIDVGKGGTIAFSPDSVTAAVGDVLQFHFYPESGPHSVVSGDFNSPCAPGANPFFSGYIKGDDSGSSSFVVNVTSTDPLFFYCSIVGHCQGGMAGVVNPSSSQTIDAYKSAAANAKEGNTPTSLQGGIATSISGEDSSSTVSSAASTSASAATTTGHASSATTAPTTTGGSAANSTVHSSTSPSATSGGSGSGPYGGGGTPSGAGHAMNLPAFLTFVAAGVVAMII